MTLPSPPPPAVTVRQRVCGDSHGSWQDTGQAWPSGVAGCDGAGVPGHGVQGVAQGEGEGGGKCSGRVSNLAGRFKES